MKHLNKDHSDIKNSTVYTPKEITNFLTKEVYSKMNISKVFDPAIGTGNLVNDLKNNGAYVVGNDIEVASNCADEFYNEDFEHFTTKIEGVDLVVMNPPFNGHPKRKLYPEVFIDKVFELFGSSIPLVAIVPSGWRINQSINSKRWRKVRDQQKISSIITLPLDVFESVKFCTEIVIFNVDGLEPHYFLDI
jgi:predicted RNA methylase